jgi:VCBS repeat protein
MRALAGRVSAALFVIAAALTLATPVAPSASAAPVAPATCATCHRVPPADVLPRAAWRDEIVRMQRIRDGSEARPDSLEPTLPKDFVDALAWYERRAPVALAPLARWPDPGPVPAFVRRKLTPPDAPPTPVVSDVELLDVDGDRRLELLVCDMRHGMVFLGRPYDASVGLTLIAKVPNPSRASMVDLDKDGIKDVLVADLGEFLPRDHDKGSVVWLRGLGDGHFAPFGIGGLPRIADVEAADFDGDGDVDLLVSAFGYRKTGGVLIFENRTTEWTRPAFEPRTIDTRPGAVRALPIDLDRDGRMDFIAVISQEHEVVVAYHNEGHMTFTPSLLYQAPHPNWGSSGLSIADLDGDGDTDVLLANGDTFDDSLLKPYHGIAWLENVGRMRFAYHRLADLPGPHGIVAADLDGDGDLDVIASALVAGGGGDQDAALPGVVWMEQVSRGHFVKHTLKMGLPRHAGVAAGDYNGDGVMDLAFGNMATTGPADAWVELWEGTRR